MTPNIFNDLMTTFYIQDGEWKLHTWPCTTDPGTFWLENPMYDRGTAVPKPGHYKRSHCLGIHPPGGYEALVQYGYDQITVYLDANRDNVIDIEGAIEITGYFGINIHKASFDGTSPVVEKWSAGCQVFQEAADFDEFMGLCRASAKIYGKYFSYTLITEADLG
jgi:hypothetical protein